MEKILNELLEHTLTRCNRKGKSPFVLKEVSKPALRQNVGSAITPQSSQKGRKMRENLTAAVKEDHGEAVAEAPDMQVLIAHHVMTELNLEKNPESGAGECFGLAAY